MRGGCGAGRARPDPSRAEAFQIPDLIRTKVNCCPRDCRIRTVEIVGWTFRPTRHSRANTREVGPIRIVDYKSKGRINKRLASRWDRLSARSPWRLPPPEVFPAQLGLYTEASHVDQVVAVVHNRNAESIPAPSSGYVHVCGGRSGADDGRVCHGPPRPAPLCGIGRGRLASQTVIHPVDLTVVKAAFGLTALPDPSDRLIVATALSLGLPLPSDDARISDSDIVRIVW